MTRVARGPIDGRTARMSRALNSDELRKQLTTAVDTFDHHMTEAQDLGRANRTVDALEHLGLANKAAREAEGIADQITALGNAVRTSTAGSNWMVEK